MSSSATERTSMTGSSSSLASDGGSGGLGRAPQESRETRVVACGALAGHIREIAARRGWRLDVPPLPARLHNRPGQIPAAVADAGPAAIVAYADCGTYGKLDELIAGTGARRLPGLHCYDLLAGPD